MALPLALLVLLVISVMGFALIGVGRTELTVATSCRAYNAAFYAADAGLQKGLVGLRDLFTTTATPSQTQLDGIAPPTLSDPKLKFAAFSIKPGAAPYRTTFTTGQYKGLYGFVTDYQITSQVTGDGGTQATLTQTVRYTSIPLFQFGVFYGKGVDLEIYPGAKPMIFNGRIHSNSDIYMKGSNASSLQVDSAITSAGRIYRDSKSEPGARQADPQIKDANGIYHALNFDHDWQPGFTTKWA
ncbi:MAG: hypothetical protein DMD82_12940, partial [Candidatus Rokuibacteriota bacterium]